MDFLLRQNLLPVVIAVTVIVISWYLLRRKSKAPKSNSEHEPSESGGEKIETVTSDKETANNKKDDDDEVTFEEAKKFLQDAGIIKAKDIQYLPEDEREILAQEVAKQKATDSEQKQKIKEMTVKDASNIQTYYKSSRLGIKEIENQMTTEELAQERETQQRQLEEIFKLLKTDKDKFGVTTMDDLQAQMKLYTR